MTKRTPTPDDISTVETELWNVVRALGAIEILAMKIGNKTTGDINALAEAIAGSAVVITSHVRSQQMALGGEE